MIKKLEILANVAVVITSVVLCSVLVKKYFFSSTKQEASVGAVQSKSPASSGSQRPSIQAGTKISLAGIYWSQSNRTLLLALSTTCHFCSESVPFYQELERQRTKGVRLVAVLPQPVNAAKNYLDKLGVRVDCVVQASLGSVGVSGTPTLLLIDHDGAVTDSWVGKLSDSEAERIVTQLRE